MQKLNPKFEYLNSKQILISQFSKFRTHWFGTFGFRIWDLFRISDFGFLIFKFCIVTFIFDIWILSLIGCVTAPYVTAPPTPGIPGIYHRVQKGQTLWRLSKIYGVDLDEIVRINRISDATVIEVGQLIFVPRYQKKPEASYKATSYSNGYEDFIWPMRGRVISSFGKTHNNMINKGLNIQPYKSENVVAARAGKVVFYSQDFESFGKTVIIDHGDGFSTIYARNSQVLIKAGDEVKKGTLIAKIYPIDKNRSTYLHFEIRKAHIPQNPYFYLTD